MKGEGSNHPYLCSVFREPYPKVWASRPELEDLSARVTKSEPTLCRVLVHAGP